MEEVEEVSRQAVAADAAKLMEGAATERTTTNTSSFSPPSSTNRTRAPNLAFTSRKQNLHEAIRPEEAVEDTKAN